MRKIQFISRHPLSSDRVYGEIANRWGFNEYGYYHTNGLPDSKYIQCQYTGLNDMHGVEIYEGDIVQYKVAEQGKIAECYSVMHAVRFDAGSFKAASHLSDWYYSEYPQLKDHLYCEQGSIAGRDRYYIEFDIEVIGNIYQNPELLTN